MNDYLTSVQYNKLWERRTVEIVQIPPCNVYRAELSSPYKLIARNKEESAFIFSAFIFRCPRLSVDETIFVPVDNNGLLESESRLLSK